jgi:peroxiredoxin Q/BCP
MSKPLAEGAKAPAFTLETSEGPISLAGLAGAPVVLYFYPKDDTSGCTREALDFSAAAPQFKKLKTRVIGVSKDTLASHDKFAAKHDLNVTLATDPDGTVIEKYGSWVEKSMYGRKYMGIDRSTFLIDGQGKLRAIWRKVKVPGHVAEVLEALKAL